MQVHRFRDRVAVSLASGETVYLTAKDAGRLSMAINKVKRELTGGVSFGDSNVGTFSHTPEPYK